MKHQIKLIENFTGYKENTICYNTGSSPNDKYGFDSNLMSGRSLRNFYERILLGESFPSKMILGTLNIEGIFAASLFSNPEMVLNSECGSFVSSFEAVSRLGDIGLSSVPEDHMNLLLSLDELVSTSEKYTSNGQKEKALERGSHLVNQYISKGQLPPAPNNEDIEVVEEANEFVAYKTEKPVLYRIYRQGFLSGLWINSSDEEDMLLFKKSQLVESPNLKAVKGELNQMEQEGEWHFLDGTPAIKSPQNTSLGPEDILDEILSS